jgi:hypothetical protein
LAEISNTGKDWLPLFKEREEIKFVAFFLPIEEGLAKKVELPN